MKADVIVCTCLKTANITPCLVHHYFCHHFIAEDKSIPPGSRRCKSFKFAIPQIVRQFFFSHLNFHFRRNDSAYPLHCVWYTKRNKIFTPNTSLTVYVEFSSITNTLISVVVYLPKLSVLNLIFHLCFFFFF